MKRAQFYSYTTPYRTRVGSVVGESGGKVQIQPDKPMGTFAGVIERRIPDLGRLKTEFMTDEAEAIGLMHVKGPDKLQLDEVIAIVNEP